MGNITGEMSTRRAAAASISAAWLTYCFDSAVLLARAAAAVAAGFAEHDNSSVPVIFMGGARARRSARRSA